MRQAMVRLDLPHGASDTGPSVTLSFGVATQVGGDTPDSWLEAADLIIRATEKTIGQKIVTYDFARLMDGATQVSCSGFGQVMIDHM